MAVESSVRQDFVTKKNREGSEPKKKMKKARSIRLSKAPSLKSSSRRSKSKFSWLSVDQSSDTSTAAGLSDSSSNYVNAASSSDAKKENYQGGNESDDAVSVVSSSHGSFVNGLPVLNQATRIKKMLKNCGSSMSFRRRGKSKSTQSSAGSVKSVSPQHPSSVDGSPNYLKETSSFGGRKAHPQASSRYSESSLTSSDQSNAQSSTSSMKSLKTVINNGKRPSLKSTQTSEDLNVDKATCSSILKDLKFPERVELHDGQTEAERISKTKVCTYHHCSLNGHSHDHTPPAKRPLNKKGGSIKSEKSKTSITESSPVVKLSGDKKKGVQMSKMNSKVEVSSEEGGLAITIHTPAEDDKDMGFSIKIYAKSRAEISIKTHGETKDAEVIQILPVESSYHEESQQESTNQVMSSSPQMEDVAEASGVKGTSVKCCCGKAEERKLTFVSANIGSDEVTVPDIGDRDQDSAKNGSGDLSHVHEPALDIKVNDQVRGSSENDSNFNRESGEVKAPTLTQKSDSVDEATENNSSTSAIDYHAIGDFRTTEEEKNSNLDPKPASVTGLKSAEDSERQFMQARDSESGTLPQEGLRTQVVKEKRISMWNLIHQHMASGLAAESKTLQLHRENEEKQVEDINPLPAAPITDSTESSPHSDTCAEKHDIINQEIELRKVFAIKLVREAIEKILLPEVPDQASDNQSVISDTISDQDHYESNYDKEYAEDSQTERDQRNVEDKADVNLNEKEKIEIKHEKRSDKRAPKHWSNLKKWIVLQRFIKALENVKEFKPKKPRPLQLEPEPDPEKVSLRHQTVEERKRAEEWMLDYALRQAVSQLAPTQKKKVSLLVKAFETVKPPQEDSGVHFTFPKLKATRDDSPRTKNIMDESFLQGKNKTKVTKEIIASRPDNQERNSIADNEATSPSVPIADALLVNTVYLKPEDMNSSPDKWPGDKKQNRDTREERAANLKTNAPKESITQLQGHEDLIRDVAVSTEITSSASGDISSKNPISRDTLKKESDGEPVNISSSLNSEFLNGGSGSGTDNIERDAVYGKAKGLSVESTLLTQAGDVNSVATRSAISSTYTDTFVPEETAKKEKHRESRAEAVVQGFYMDSKSNDNATEEEKRNYIRMWHTVYQHVVSSIAEKVGPGLLEGTDDEETEDDDNLPEFSSENEEAGDQNSAAPWIGQFSKSDAVKLVQEAVDEILLPEIQDDSSETQSVTSDIVQDQEISEKNHTEGREQNTSNSPELTRDDMRIDGSKEDNKAELLVHNKSELPKPKNWSKLKKMILLKRSLKALETARKVKSHARNDLPLTADLKPGKVDLRQQMSDERNKAEQWMLDYAVQHIVNKLTPARKRRVAMLVEAFEAVVPLPEI